MPKKTVRIGIIGAGAIAQVEHIPALKKLKDVEIVAICDHDEERAQRVAQKFGIERVVEDYEELVRMDDIDGVHICTPNFLHAPMTVAALSYGKNVLCEKPLARNALEAEEMVKAAEKAKKILMPAVNNRFRADSRLLKKFVEKGELGQILYAKTGWLRRPTEWRDSAWHGDKKVSGGGVLMDLGVHMLDLCLWLMGNPGVVSVTASTYSKAGKRDVEDSATCFLRLEGGATVTLEVSWTLLLESNFGYLNLYGRSGVALLNPLRIHKEMHGTLANVTPSVEPTRNIHKQSYEAEIEHFVDCVRKGETPVSSAKEGLEVMRVVDAIYKSAETKKEVKLS
ncbi:MAG: Gfo/Idh/MocA family oxidoreductase [Candidatus Eisenbacteria bacterium]|nr:Gfo/Idh/MocA family oxidoreductase [Candidatus Eisenbacteria bacterium]